MINTTPAKVIEPSPSNDEVVLSVEGVSKKFCRDLKRSLFYGVQDIAGELTGVRQKSDRLRSKEFWALDNVSFELRKGEALGLVGKNGSGKSTLLRIIAGLIKPDLGTVKVTGRVAPLIALGAGFNPILTGRENIYANMSILGLSTKEIDERFDDVVEFAEIGEAIDSPVQTYSSGMAARLGFASAIHTEPDILLIDEVLAVGDVKFRQKCFRRLHKLRHNGTSFVLVTHQTQSILNACHSALYLSKGKLAASGDIFSIVSQYEKELFSNESENIIENNLIFKKNQNNDLEAEIASIHFRDKKNQIINSLITGEEAYFCVICTAHKKVKNIGLTLDIHKVSEEDGYNIVLSSFNDKKTFDLSIGNHEIQLQMPCICLKPGLYSAIIYIRKDSLCTLDHVESFKFKVECRESIGRSLFYQPRSWKIAH